MGCCTSQPVTPTADKETLSRHSSVCPSPSNVRTNSMIGSVTITQQPAAKESEKDASSLKGDDESAGTKGEEDSVRRSGDGAFFPEGKSAVDSQLLHTEVSSFHAVVSEKEVKQEKTPSEDLTVRLCVEVQPLFVQKKVVLKSEKKAEECVTNPLAPQLTAAVHVHPEQEQMVDSPQEMTGTEGDDPRRATSHREEDACSLDPRREALPPVHAPLHCEDMRVDSMDVLSQSQLKKGHEAEHEVSAATRTTPRPITKPEPHESFQVPAHVPPSEELRVSPEVKQEKRLEVQRMNFLHVHSETEEELIPVHQLKESNGRPESTGSLSPKAHRSSAHPKGKEGELTPLSCATIMKIAGSPNAFTPNKSQQQQQTPHRNHVAFAEGYPLEGQGEEYRLVSPRPKHHCCSTTSELLEDEQPMKATPTSAQDDVGATSTQKGLVTLAPKKDARRSGSSSSSIWFGSPMQASVSKDSRARYRCTLEELKQRSWAVRCPPSQLQIDFLPNDDFLLKKTRKRIAHWIDVSQPSTLATIATEKETLSGAFSSSSFSGSFDRSAGDFFSVFPPQHYRRPNDHSDRHPQQRVVRPNHHQQHRLRPEERSGESPQACVTGTTIGASLMVVGDVSFGERSELV